MQCMVQFVRHNNEIIVLETCWSCNSDRYSDALSILLCLKKAEKSKSRKVKMMEGLNRIAPGNIMLPKW